MPKIETTLPFEYVTKGSVLYKVSTPDAHINNLYVRKGGFTDKYPTKIRITVEWDTNDEKVPR